MPQHAKRTKIRRKDLRQPDEFETLTGQALAWIETHRGLLLGAAGAVLAVALVVLAVNRARTSRNEAAAADFNAAHELLAAAKHEEAATAFEEVATKYPSAPFGHLARLYRGHALARRGDAAGAAAAYTEYLASDPPAAYLRQEALASLGRAKEASGDTAGALDAYTQAGAVEGPYRTDALLGAARMHERAGEADKAREIYARLLAENPQGDLRPLLASKLPGSQPPASSGPAEAGANVNTK
jgi:tetratricopeptide (TPR) repeat protein